MIEVKHLTKSFVQGDKQHNVIEDVNFSVAKGEFVSIIGKSGSGKSTLLALLGALDRPDSGEISVGAETISKLHAGKLTEYRNRRIGFIFQSFNLIPNLSALENVMLAMELAGKPKTERIARGKVLLAQVGIDETKQGRKPGKLSGGEQQRVAIARALANKPSLILADEPTGNLDSQTGKQIFDLLHSLSRTEKTTIIVVTHDMAIAGKTDQTFTLKDGELSVNSRARRAK